MDNQKLQFLLTMLDLLAVGFKTFPRIYTRYKENRNIIQNMIDEDRDPTPEEWQKLQNDINQVSIKLQS